MTENSMFFSDGSWYTQNMFARFISDIFGEGVVDGIDNELEVSANSPANMAVQVKTGRSYVKGYIHEILTDPVQLTISDADTTNPRIDRIVLRLDVSTNRRIRVAVLEGTAAASPVAPTLTQTSSVWEISLAQVYVSANATVINSGNITDERTFMTFQRGNQPITSKSAFGAVKVGTGVDVSDGVISVSYGIYPMMARLYTTDQGFGGYFILANVYQGTLGTKQSGLIYQNDTESTTRSLTFTATATNTSASGSTSTYTFTFKAKDVLTLVERTLGTASGSGDGGTVKTHSVTYDVKLTEIITYSFSASQSYWSSSISATNNNIYLGRPT